MEFVTIMNEPVKNTLFSIMKQAGAIRSITEESEFKERVHMIVSEVSYNCEMEIDAVKKMLGYTRVKEANEYLFKHGFALKF